MAKYSITLDFGWGNRDYSGKDTLTETRIKACKLVYDWTKDGEDAVAEIYSTKEIPDEVIANSYDNLKKFVRMDRNGRNRKVISAKTGKIIG